MSPLVQCAIRDAEADFIELTGKPKEDWLAEVASIRRGDVTGPSVRLLEDVGRESLCKSWAVRESDWTRRSVGWLREYDGIYCSAIEILVLRGKRAP